MEQLPSDWLALLILVFTLGSRHGLDADHLATVDGLTRFNGRHPVARWCGVLFSLGHGLAVTAVAVLIGFLAKRWMVPAWMEDVGAWTSIAFLTVLGILNLRAVLLAPPGEVVRPVGIKGRLFRRLQATRNPWLILLVGVLFALSFDTMSQAALFSLAATGFGGWQHSLALGVAFMAGMMVTDGINGLWISRLLRRADQIACVASRVMGLTVGGLSLGIAAFGVAKYVSPSVSSWGEGKELAIGLAVIGVVAVSFLVVSRAARYQAADA